MAGQSVCSGVAARACRDAIAADPVSYLGPAHVDRFGPDPGLLVKLLDAGQRLPVHCHPGRAFAGAALGSPHGKTEAWVIVEAEPDASVYVGFTRDVGLDEVRAWMGDQDSAAMLGAMHELPVAAGDAIEPVQEVGESPQRLLGLLHPDPGEVQLLAVVRSQVEIPQRRGAETTRADVLEVVDVAERLGHLLG